MTPIVKSLPSYIKDSNHALEIFRTFSFSGENKIIFTMDITSLYTVIPNNEGLQGLKYFLNQRPVKSPSSETLLRLAELVRAQEIDRNTALQSPQNEETNRIPFTLTYHPQNLTVKNVILKNFKIIRNDPETKHMISLPPLVSFKRDKNIGNFLVRSAFKSDNQPGTFKCTCTRCKTCPFISNMVKISGPNRSAKITDHFTCISANVIYCITCTLCKKIYINETGKLTQRTFPCVGILTRTVCVSPGSGIWHARHLGTPREPGDELSTIIVFMWLLWFFWFF